MPLHALLIALGALTEPQDRPVAAPARREARVVFLDAKDAPVVDISEADVAVTEDGVARPATLHREEDAAHIALLVDSSQPVATSYRHHFLDAVRAFLSGLADGSKVSVWTTGDRPRKVADALAAGADTTREILDALRRTPATGGNTVLDAVTEAAEDLRRAEGARRVVVFLSADGAGFMSRDREFIVRRGLESGAVFMGVLVGADAEGGGEVSRLDYDYALGGLSRRSGGRYETPLTAMSAGAALQKVARDLRAGYTISWESAGTGRGRVDVQIAREKVRARLSDPRATGGR
jgi:hypothetical protein